MNSAELPLPPGYRLFRYDTIGSTNDEAKLLAGQGMPDGTLVWALAQTGGRGRRGRPWVSPPGNLYASLLLRPGCTAAQAAQFGFVAALALVDALAPLIGEAVVLDCKWPNDLLANGRKLAGILLESATGLGDGVSFLVIGIGVNLVSSPPAVEFPATSLAEEGAAVASPAIVLEGFARHFAIWARRWREDGFMPVRAAWKRRATGLGEAIRVRLPDITLEGRFGDIDAEGALLLDDDARGRRRIAAGEIFPAMR